MSDLSNVRILTGDGAVYVKESVVLTQAAPSFQVTYAPLVARSANGVIITLESGAALDPNVNPFTVDYENGVVTFTGTVPAAQTLTVEYSHVFLTDASVQALLDLNVDGSDVVRLSAADALDVMATQQAIILKRGKLLDMETDGPSVAKSLREHAATLRELVYSDKFVESAFDFAQEINDTSGYREKVLKDWLRENP